MEIPATNVRIDNHILRLICDRQVIDLKEQPLQPRQLRIICRKKLMRTLINEKAPSTVVKLQIAAACCVEIADHLLIAIHNVRHQRLFAVINTERLCTVYRHDELLQYLRRRRNRLLRYRLCVFKLLDELKMFHKRMRRHRKLSREKRVIDLRRLIMELQPVLRWLVADALKSPHKIQMPGRATEFPVCDHMIPCRLLLIDQFCDRRILHRLQLGRCNAPCFVIGARRFQRFRAQKAANIIITKWCI